MNPDNRPVKFKKDTRVKVTKQGIYHGSTGTVLSERQDGYDTRVELDDDRGTMWLSDHELEALPELEVGDLVRVKAYGQWQAQEGHIVSENLATFSVDFGYDEKAAFGASALELVEKVSPKPFRREGQPIKRQDIKRGDVISVVTVEDKDVKRTVIVEATVDKIIKKDLGNVVEFQTRSGGHIHFARHNDEAVISLVKSIDNNAEYIALSEARIGDIVAFPDEEGGPETNLAVKHVDDYWTVVLGTKSKNVQTVGLVNILAKKGVTFSVVRKAEPEFEFPKGTHVKVSRGFSDSLANGDWKVIIEGKEESTIKSRGISANTFKVPNRYLSKA